MLSDEECREIWRTALARCHPTNDISVAGVFATRAAYALGVERASKSPDAATRAVIERLTDVTTFLLDIVEKVADGPVAFRPSIADPREAIAEARKLLEDDGWIRVEDALPVVPPLYAEVAIWMVDSRFPNPIRKTFRVTDKALHQYITHWQYDIQPKPPKD